MKNILITGVSKGLGLKTTENMLRKGECNIFGVSREMTDELDFLLKQFPRKLKWLEFDLTNYNAIEHEIFEDFVGIDTPLSAFINNAAVHYVNLISQMPNEKIFEQFDTNFISPILQTKFAVKNFLRHKTAGSIIHMSSISVHMGSQGLGFYSATKAGLEAFSRTTAKEYGKRGIRSNVIVAGLMNIGMGTTVPKSIVDGVISQSALQKLTDYKSVVDMIEYLLSEKAISITGHNLYVDSGT